MFISPLRYKWTSRHRFRVYSEDNGQTVGWIAQPRIASPLSGEWWEVRRVVLLAASRRRTQVWEAQGGVSTAATRASEDHNHYSRREAALRACAKAGCPKAKARLNLESM